MQKILVSVAVTLMVTASVVCMVHTVCIVIAAEAAVIDLARTRRSMEITKRSGSTVTRAGSITNKRVATRGQTDRQDMASLLEGRPQPKS